APVSGLQELGVGFVAKLGVGERRHVALQILVADMRGGGGVHLVGEVGIGAALRGARDTLRDRAMGGAGFFEAAAQLAGNGGRSEQTANHCSALRDLSGWSSSKGCTGMELVHGLLGQ